MYTKNKEKEKMEGVESEKSEVFVSALYNPQKYLNK
jgi:hypothetical protein